MNNNSYCNSSSDLTNGSIYIDRARQMLCSSGPGSEAGAGNDCLDFSGRRAALSCCLLHSLPQDFTTNPTVQHRQCPLPVFSLWVEETPLMRQGSAPICLMTGKADSSALPLPVLAQACLVFLFLFFCFFSHSASLQQEFPTAPHVDPATPRLVRALHSLACVVGLECLPAGLWHVDLCRAWKSGLQCGTGTACSVPGRVLLYLSQGCQKRRENLLLACFAIIQA